MTKQEKTRSYSHILKSTGLFGGVQVLSILVGIVRNKLVALILGPQGMGLVSLFNSTTLLVSNTTNFGIPMSAVKNISEEYDNGNEAQMHHAISVVRYWSILTAILGTLLCIILSPFLSWFTFSWNGHTLHFICLSPVIGLTAITGGELAILKGVRQLKHLASISIYSVIAALVISVPIYYFFGDAGIVPSLVLMALAQMLLTVFYSYHLFPLKFDSKKKGLFNDGLSMIKLGTAFVISGLLSSGADFLIRSYINNVALIDTVGLYNAGMMMTMTYVSMVFAAMETDYFPRLSGVSHLGVTFNTTVNRQIEVMLLLVSPLLVAFMILLPVLVPLFYSDKFLPVIGMTQIIVFAMYFRALKLPVEYIPLAKGDSLSYLFLEGTYNVVLLLLVVLLFRHFGLRGAGMAIAFAAVFDFVMVFAYDKWKYGYVVSTNVLLYASIQLPIGALAYGVTYIDNPLLYWVTGGLLFFVSLMVSLTILRSKSSLWSSLKAKIKAKLGRD